MLLRTSPILAETVSPLGSRRFFSRITRSDPAAAPVRARFEAEPWWLTTMPSSNQTPEPVGFGDLYGGDSCTSHPAVP
jgi:hypothetical protein